MAIFKVRATTAKAHLYLVSDYPLHDQVVSAQDHLSVLYGGDESSTLFLVLRWSVSSYKLVGCYYQLNNKPYPEADDFTPEGLLPLGYQKLFLYDLFNPFIPPEVPPEVSILTPGDEELLGVLFPGGSSKRLATLAFAMLFGKHERSEPIKFHNLPGDWIKYYNWCIESEFDSAYKR
ncbi:hypothetical protein QQX98_005815 [Neonectria punicea]|uniref:Uncharacterized protein n=1 Tax=Neonectria punicea TaxID=979145 RepID=A0ABR1H376_9HYPO